MTVFIPCLDPAHGGQDLGAVRPTKFGEADGEVREKDLSLETCKRLNASFAGTAILPVMTRQADFDPSWAARYKTAKDGGARFVLSVHYNASRVNYIRRAEAYHYPTNERTRQIGRKWLRTMPEELRSRKVFAATDDPGPDDDWLQRPLVIIEAFRELPVLVAEVGYLNGRDLAYLMSPWAIDRVVCSLRVAVLEAARVYSS